MKSHAVLSDFTMEMECFRQKANAHCRSVAKLDVKIKLIGQGVGSHQGNMVKKFCQDSGGGDLLAYAYLIFKFEGELHYFTTTLNSSAAGTMTNTLLIDIGGNDRNETKKKTSFNKSPTPSSLSMSSSSKKAR